MIISAWWLRTSSKFSGQEFEKIPENIDWIIGNSLAGADSSNREVVIVMKGVQIVPQVTVLCCSVTGG